MNSVVNVPESNAAAMHLERPNEHVVVHTTLYDLIEAMHEVIAPHEDARVVQAITHLFDTGRLAFCHSGASQPRQPEASESDLASYLWDMGSGRTVVSAPGHDSELTTTPLEHLTDTFVGSHV